MCKSIDFKKHKPWLILTVTCVALEIIFEILVIIFYKIVDDGNPNQIYKILTIIFLGVDIVLIVLMIYFMHRLIRTWKKENEEKGRISIRKPNSGNGKIWGYVSVSLAVLQITTAVLALLISYDIIKIRVMYAAMLAILSFVLIFVSFFCMHQSILILRNK